MRWLADQLSPAWAITRREVRDQFRDWRIIFPIIGLTVLFPFLMNFTADRILNFVEQYGATIVGERLVPFLLMIVGFFPISVSLVIALETFVGEKERGSIEPLLNTPLKDWQLYLGKLLSATVPPLAGSYLGMAVYLSGLYFNNIPIPAFGMLIMIFCLTTIQAVVMVSGAVVVSTQATSVRAANLLASFIIIPIALLVQGESVIMFWDESLHSLWWIIFWLIILSITLIRVGLAHFQREELLGREIDVLNFRWMWKIFWGTFTGGASNILVWYKAVIPKALKKIRLPSLFITGLVIAGVIIGIHETKIFPIALPIDDPGELNRRVEALLDAMPLFSAEPVLMIWFLNLRTLTLSMILGLISLGILGVMPLFATMALVGFLFATLQQNGLPALLYLGFVVPHGVIEIPAAIIAVAAILRSGALMATPTQESTVGEVMIRSLADWFKIMLGVVIPLLLIAAMIEVWITPQIVLKLLPLFSF